MVNPARFAPITHDRLSLHVVWHFGCSNVRWTGSFPQTQLYKNLDPGGHPCAFKCMLVLWWFLERILFKCKLHFIYIFKTDVTYNYSTTSSPSNRLHPTNPLRHRHWTRSMHRPPPQRQRPPHKR
jgi:hypothetical protein